MMAPLTGRKVLAMTLAAFGVIVAVNVVLAVMAVRTFPGMETRNSYVASQTFDRDRAAQQTLGWTVDASYADGLLTIAVTDAANGKAAEIADLSAVVGWATHAKGDMRPTFVETGGAHRAAVDLGPGNWTIYLQARAADGTPFRQRLPLYVAGPG